MKKNVSEEIRQSVEMRKEIYRTEGTMLPHGTPHNAYQDRIILDEDLELDQIDQVNSHDATTAIKAFRSRNSDRDREVLRLAAVGTKQTEIAELMGVSLSVVFKVLNTPVAKQHLRNMHRQRDEEFLQVQDRIRDMVHKALDELDDVFTPQEVETKDGQTIQKKAKDADRIRAALGILDRGGHAPQREISQTKVTMKVDVLEAMRERARIIKEQREQAALPLSQEIVVEQDSTNDEND